MGTQGATDDPSERSADELAQEFMAHHPGVGPGDPVARDFVAPLPPEKRGAVLNLISLAAGGDSIDPREAVDENQIPTVKFLAESLESASRPARRTGQRIGPYEIVAKVGQGGNGVIYRAHQEEPVRRDVALKCIRGGRRSDEALTRFRNEGQALASMDHPHIATIHDAGVTGDGEPWYAMEWIDGQPLDTALDGARAGIDERLEIFAKVCRAVHHAHRRGLLHRDLKPANILVSRTEAGEAVPHVIDFGLAKALEADLLESPYETVAGQLLGTPLYMSPEQITSPETVDTRTDVYALGLILYRLLVGTLPYRLEKPGRLTLEELRHHVLEEDLPTPSARLSAADIDVESVAQARGVEPAALRRRLRGDLGWITLTALARERERRYESALELARDVERFLAGEPVVAHPPSLAYTLGKAARRHRAKVAAATGVLAVLLAVGALAVLSTRSEIRSMASDVREATGAGRFEEAIASLAALREVYPEETATQEVTARLAGGLEASARESHQAFLESSRRARELQVHWAAEHDALPEWRPVWEREEELRLWRETQEARRELNELAEAALERYRQAAELVVDVPKDARRLAAARAELYALLAADYEGDVATLDFEEFFRRRVGDFGDTPARRRLEGGATVRIRSEPAGVEVHAFVFREDPQEARRLPFPFHPARGLVGDTVVRVERIWREGGCPFEPGDTLVAIGERPLRVPGDLARALGELGVGEGEAVTVTVRRGGVELQLDWTPFGSHVSLPGAPPWKVETPTRLVSFPYQLGFTVEAQPLELTPANLLGSTAGGRALEALFPRGSYLLVLGGPGGSGVRYPLVVPPEDASGIGKSVEGPASSELASVEITLRLPREDAAPPGFLWIPGGPTGLGGDAGAFQPLPRKTAAPRGFLLARHEVTVGEWREFLNAPEVGARTGPDGNAVIDARAEAGRDLLEELGKSDCHPAITVAYAPYFQRDSATGLWEPTGRVPGLHCPAFGVSHLAALEYAHWLTERARANGKPWRFRLPTDEEWERAARGADRRAFVWGDYRVWAFAWSQRGLRLADDGAENVAPVGFVSTDESVFGIRDMTGSVTEHTGGQPVEHYPYRAYRGGSFENFDEYFFRAATRNGMYPHQAYAHFGLRLAADVGEETP